jgi:hypothetical protein
VFSAKLEILLTAPRGDVHDARAGGRADVLPGNDAVRLPTGDPRGPVLPNDDIRQFRGVPTRMSLCRQFVEWPVVLPADEIRSGQFSEDLKALLRFLLKKLLDGPKFRCPSFSSWWSIHFDLDVVVTRSLGGANSGQGIFT